MKKINFNRKDFNYSENTHFYGRIWDVLAVIFICAFPIMAGLIFNAWPTAGQLGKGLLAIIPIFWTVGIVEVFTYTPMLGAGSSYLGFVTGNLSNLKVPCALNCMKGADIKAGTPEGEIISTISTAVSSIVTVAIIILGVCLIVPLTPVIENPKISAAFDNILPALFGALGVVYISRNWKIALPPVILMLVLFIAIPSLGSNLVSVMVPVGAIFSIIVSRIMYKKGWLNEKEIKISEEAAINDPTSVASEGAIADETTELSNQIEEVKADEILAQEDIFEEVKEDKPSEEAKPSEEDVSSENSDKD